MNLLTNINPKCPHFRRISDWSVKFTDMYHPPYVIRTLSRVFVTDLILVALVKPPHGWRVFN